MVTLQELPTEILSHVFSYFVSDTHLLRNLALQCHCFSLAVRPILLRQVYLAANGGPRTLKVELFNRTIRENPDLSEMVRSLSLSWSESNAELHGNIESLLGRLTTLRVLKVQNNTDQDCFKHNYLDANPMYELSEVTLNDTNMTVENFARYIFLENIHHLTVLWLRNPTPPTFDLLGFPVAKWPLPMLPKNKRPGSSPLAVLDFGPIFHLPELIMKEILSWPKALKSLRCTITGRDFGGRFGVSKQMTTIFSPESVARALSPTKVSLEHLELIDAGCEWPGHDWTQLDLTEFKSLARINVPSTCYFKNFTHGTKREGLYALLPSSLVELKIMYDLDDCIRPNEEERAPIPANSHNLDLDHSIGLELLNLGSPKDLKWLLEVAENKEKCFPGLKRVSLIERCGLLRAGVHPTNWTLPPALAEAFSHTGIEFRAVMRAITPAPTFD